MRKPFQNMLAYVLIASVFLTSCGTTGGAILYSEKSVLASDVRINRVAIVPNRLPINLQDSEYWRQSNWEIIASKFKEKGYEVIDYNTSVSVFQNSGLPLEDTKSSRDKYADLANDLNADILVFPYYGMSYARTGLLETNNYYAIGSLQIYSVAQNDFISRIDFDGRNYNVSGGIAVSALSSILSGIIVSASASSFDPTDPTSSPSGGAGASVILGLLPLAFALGNIKPQELRYQEAFAAGISEGMALFFSRYEGASRQPSSVPQQRRTDNANSSTQPTSTNPYAKYSLQELENMKQAAVQAKDYAKAAEIKKEIDRRK